MQVQINKWTLRTILRHHHLIWLCSDILNYLKPFTVLNCHYIVKYTVRIVFLFSEDFLIFHFWGNFTYKQCFTLDTRPTFKNGALFSGDYPYATQFPCLYQLTWTIPTQHGLLIIAYKSLILILLWLTNLKIYSPYITNFICKSSAIPCFIYNVTRIHSKSLKIFAQLFWYVWFYFYIPYQCYLFCVLSPCSLLYLIFYPGLNPDLCILKYDQSFKYV